MSAWWLGDPSSSRGKLLDRTTVRLKLLRLLTNPSVWHGLLGQKCTVLRCDAGTWTKLSDKWAECSSQILDVSSWREVNHHSSESKRSTFVQSIAKLSHRLRSMWNQGTMRCLECAYSLCQYLNHAGTGDPSTDDTSRPVLASLQGNFPPARPNCFAQHHQEKFQDMVLTILVRTEKVATWTVRDSGWVYPSPPRVLVDQRRDFWMCCDGIAPGQETMEMYLWSYLGVRQTSESKRSTFVQ